MPYLIKLTHVFGCATSHKPNPVRKTLRGVNTAMSGVECDMRISYLYRCKKERFSWLRR